MGRSALARPRRAAGPRGRGHGDRPRPAGVRTAVAGEHARRDQLQQQRYGQPARYGLPQAVSGDIVDLRWLPLQHDHAEQRPDQHRRRESLAHGAGPAALTIQNGNGAKYTNRIFNHTGTGTLIVQGMTVSGGVISGNAYCAGTRAAAASIRKARCSLGNAFFITDALTGVRCHELPRDLRIDQHAQRFRRRRRRRRQRGRSDQQHRQRAARRAAPTGSGGGVFASARLGI